MNVELISTTAEDGLRLDGALHAPRADSASGLPADAFIFLHGVGSNFYGSSLFASLTEPLVERGAAVLWANTRGHDGLYTAWIRGRARRLGAAYEIVDQCQFDLTAWIAALRERGHRRIGLVGHSLGAIKSVYFQAHAADDAVACVVAASPPRLSYAVFKQGRNQETFLEAMTAAERHVEQGAGESLLEVRFPFPLVISAATFVDKYGPQEHYNIVKFVSRVNCPLLFTYGGVELAQGGEAFAEAPAALMAAARGDQRLEVATIAGANHIYTDRHGELADVVVNWLEANA
ncbi:MAG: alpha/beta fold hydrolase [Pirellulaceae bacterium]